MSELANYSIETDQVVLLSFKDGRNMRVPLKHLSHYIRGGDLAKVKKALNLRRHFLRIHMPRLFVVLAAVGGLVALLSLSGKSLAGLFSRPPAPQAAPHTGIARNQLLPTPQLSSSPMPPAQADVRLTSTSHPAARPKAASLQPAAATVTPAPVPVVSTPLPFVGQPSSAVVTVPVASPVPSPTASPRPTASPSPSPSPAQSQGQVLGDSTAPNSGSVTP